MENTFTLQKRIEPTAPDDYKYHAWQSLKQEAGLQLYKLFEQHKNPVIIEIDEKIDQIPRGFQGIYGYYDNLRIDIRLTDVSSRYVQITNMKGIDAFYKVSWTQKVRWKLESLWKRVYS